MNIPSQPSAVFLGKRDGRINISEDLDAGSRTSRSTTPDDLYRLHVPEALRFAYLLVRDQATAEDVTHDAFLACASRIFYLRDPDKFGPYLRAAVVRRVLMQRRSRDRELARWDRLAQAPSSPNGGGSESRLDLSAAMSKLPRRQQVALVLKYWADLPESEIAEPMACRPGTVKSTLSRAINALKESVPDDPH